MSAVQLTQGEPAELGIRFLDLVRGVSGLAQGRGERARIGLSGGSVAETFLPVLATEPELSSILDVFWCDERAVPLSDEQSNYRRAKELWLDPCGLGPDSVFPLVAEPNLEQGARDYELKLGERPARPLDLALLGVGSDGHIASLFPAYPTLESRRWVETVLDAPKPPPKRLTLTFEVFKRVPHIVVAAFGQSKAQAMAEAMHAESQLPIARLLRLAPSVELFLDRAAASGMKK